ncbi:MAG TPA: GNAT family protein [Limnochordia bacterium]|nr:GNAT family protein [Limnochordia bacterium]
MPVLIGSRVLLRELLVADFPRMVEWSCDAEINRLIDGNYPESLEECPEWFRRITSNRHALRLGIARRRDQDAAAGEPPTHESHPLIGDIELDHITWRSGEAELRIRIGEKSLWNQGYGSDAVATLLQHAFAGMHLRRVYLRVYRFNARAIRCYEKCGFRKEGRLIRPCSDGERHEVILMSVHAAARQAAPRALADAV